MVSVRAVVESLWQHVDYAFVGFSDQILLLSMLSLFL